MLALSCLDAMANLDPTRHDVLKFMSSHGYLKHLIESVVSFHCSQNGMYYRYLSIINSNDKIYFLYNRKRI